MVINTTVTYMKMPLAPELSSLRLYRDYKRFSTI